MSGVRDPVPPTVVVHTPHLPLACFTGRLEHLLDDELIMRWHSCAAAVASGGSDPRAAARGVADRAVYLDEMERRSIDPADVERPVHGRGVAVPVRTMSTLTGDLTPR